MPRRPRALQFGDFGAILRPPWRRARFCSVVFRWGVAKWLRQRVLIPSSQVRILAPQPDLKISRILPFFITSIARRGTQWWYTFDCCQGRAIHLVRPEVRGHPRRDFLTRRPLPRRLAYLRRRQVADKSHTTRTAAASRPSRKVSRWVARLDGRGASQSKSFKYVFLARL